MDGSRVKHGRRHLKLKEQTYSERFAQRAEGYARPYAPIDVAEPERPPAPPPPAESPLGLKVGRKAKRQLARLGLRADEEEDAP